NTATGYRGTVDLTSTDTQAGLPADYTFTATDNGAHTFAVTLKTAGSQSVTATDTVTGSLTATRSGISVQGDTAAPTITAKTPTAGANSVSKTCCVTATFSEAVQGNTISCVLKDQFGQSVSASLAYNASTRTATLTPAASLRSNAKYTVSLSGAKDMAGNAMRAVSWNFTTAKTVWHQGGSDFNSGSFSTTALSAPATGGVQLASTFSEQFSGTALSSAWTRTVYQT